MGSEMCIRDRRVLHGEMVNWPFLETDAAAATPAKIEIKAPVPGAL